jgi:hypothetical protein
MISKEGHHDIRLTNLSPLLFAGFPFLPNIDSAVAGAQQDG